MGESNMLVSILAAAVSSGTPILFAALGELITETAGVMNIGVEGMMLVGAVAGFLASVRTGNLLLGAGGPPGWRAPGSSARVHVHSPEGEPDRQRPGPDALRHGDQRYLGKSMIGVPLPNHFRSVPLPALSRLPVLGPVLFNHDVLVYLSFVLVPAVWQLFYRTRPGLHLRAVERAQKLPTLWV